MPQWLSIAVEDPRESSGRRITRFNGRPVGFAQLLNTFTVKDGWQFEQGGMVQSKGYSQIGTKSKTLCTMIIRPIPVTTKLR